MTDQKRQPLQGPPSVSPPSDQPAPRPWRTEGVGGEFPIVPQDARTNSLALIQPGPNPCCACHAGSLRTEHTALLNRSTHVATFGVARAPAPRTDLTPP
jgi:hypothetical protein